MPDYGERAVVYPPFALAPARWTLAARNTLVGRPGEAAYRQGSNADYASSPTYAALASTATSRVSFAMALTDRVGLYLARALGARVRNVRVALRGESIDMTLTGTTWTGTNTVVQSLGYAAFRVATRAFRATPGAAAIADWTGATFSVAGGETSAPIWVRALSVDATAGVDQPDAATAERNATLGARWREIEGNSIIVWRGRTWRAIDVRAADDRKREMEIDIMQTVR